MTNIRSGIRSGVRPASLMLCLALSGALLAPGMAKADVAASNNGSSSGIIALSSLPNPPATLATAKVVDAKGTMVGAVQKVVMDASGKPLSVAVALLGTNTVVSVNANSFNYDQANNVLMAHLDAKAIAEAPRVPG